MDATFDITSLGKARHDSSVADALLPWILRIGLAGCFIGHGAFGIITKAAWVPYFAVGGVTEPQAWQLMPWVGAMDIAVGLLVLARPCRALLVWGVLWATWTALLRPLAGEPIWEFIERAGNFGVPLGLLALAGINGPFFSRLHFVLPDSESVRRVRLAWVLRLTTFLLLVGHGGLGLFVQKAALAKHYAALGLSNSAALVPVIGAFELFLAALVLLRPRPGLLVGVCLWKLSSECLFLVVGSPFWEVIERFGSYTAPLALALLLLRRRAGPNSNSAQVS